MPDPIRLILEKNVPVRMRDGSDLRADVFHPADAGRYPVILTVGPYGKDIHFKDFHARFYETIDEHGEFMNWETANPEWWVPQGYTVVRVDERGTGCSPGRMELFSEQERLDFYDSIEWCGSQPWSSGKVGLLGISYYAILQWHVAALQPPHLAAIVPWEAAVDLYREFGYHGGILNNVWVNAWWKRQITKNQNAMLAADSRDSDLEQNRDLPADQKAHPLVDDYWEADAVDLSAIRVPVLSSGNWGGYALHLRGNVEGYLGSATAEKWLEIHTGNHLAPFYTPESRALQKRFLDHWLKGVDTGLLDEPRVTLAIRTSTGYFWRQEADWPIPDTNWTRLYLDARAGLLSDRQPSRKSSISYPAPDGGVLFLSEPYTERTEITGPVALRMTIASDVHEMDIFVSLISLDASGTEITCDDAQDSPGPLTKGWLRASQRQLDPQRSTEYRPVHTHRLREPLVPGEPVEVVVEIRPTSMTFESGHRLGLAVEAHDRRDNTTGYYGHDDPDDRPTERLVGTNTILSGPDRPCYLLVPVIPPRTAPSNAPQVS